MFITRALVLVICVAQSNSVSRNVVKELSVTNGQGWGDWRNLQLCPQPGQYAYGYKMRVIYTISLSLVIQYEEQSNQNDYSKKTNQYYK